MAAAETSGPPGSPESVEYLKQNRILGAATEIARVKFPFPNEEHPDYDTLVNLPTPRIAVGQADGQDLFPEIVVVRRPGQWLMEMAAVEIQETINDESALTRWLPFSKCGELLLYVPMGCAPEAQHLCRKHNIRLLGIRTWRFRPVWGLDVAEV